MPEASWVPGKRWDDLTEASVAETQELFGSWRHDLLCFVELLLGEREHPLDALLGDPRTVFRHADF